MFTAMISNLIIFVYLLNPLPPPVLPKKGMSMIIISTCKCGHYCSKFANNFS